MNTATAIADEVAEVFGGACALWHFDIPRDGRLADETVLSPAERSYAAALCESARFRFVFVRSRLRERVSNYLGVTPGEVHFRRDSNGKLHLTGLHLHFNISHTRGRALIALSRTAPVGVDIERVRSIESSLAIGGRYFSAEDVRLLCAAAPWERTHIFLRAWTAREALLKACGLGLTGLSAVKGLGFARIGADQLTVTFHRHTYRLCHFARDKQYVAAVALQVE